MTTKLARGFEIPLPSEKLQTPGGGNPLFKVLNSFKGKPVVLIRVTNLNKDEGVPIARFSFTRVSASNVTQFVFKAQQGSSFASLTFVRPDPSQNETRQASLNFTCSLGEFSCQKVFHTKGLIATVASHVLLCTGPTPHQYVLKAD